MFEQYLGRRQGELFDHPLTQKGVGFWLERVLGFYGEAGGVDVEVIDHQLALTEKTAEYIYQGDFTPRTLHYVAGSRPMLEQVLKQILRPGLSRREMTLTIMRRVRDNQDHGLARPYLFYGGNEEDMLRRGALMCNEVSRLFVCLCQIAGLPARLFAAHIAGHMMAEVLVDGRWWWIDPMKGIAPVNAAGQPISAWEIHRQPEILERQPRSVWDDIRSPTRIFSDDPRDARHQWYCLARTRDCYFHKHEAIAVGNYFAWEQHRYSFPWCLDAADNQRLIEARMAEARNCEAMGYPNYYFLTHLFNDFREPPTA